MAARDIVMLLDELRDAYADLKREKGELRRELDQIKAENRYLKNYIDDLELSPTKKRSRKRGISQLLTQYSEEEEEESNKNIQSSISVYKKTLVQLLKESSSPTKASQATTVILLSPTKMNNINNEVTKEIPGSIPFLVEPLIKDEHGQESEPEEDIIEDSENEESLIIPADFTRLQRKHLKLQHLEAKYWNDLTYTINLTTNPITENSWIITDFKRNHHYKPRHLSQFKRTKLHTTNDKENMLQFYKALNNENKSDIDDDKDDSDDEENELSQLAGKWPSPPGFMRSEFPNTQEHIQRQAIIDARIKDRLRRRLKLSLRQGMWLFTVDILNKYVSAKRFLIDMGG
ncbi:uncharacterized protein KQ657_004662 [Scheffersomyces spartinae]|uniref:Uncharacterized protein n=1 Tax=Scheffersomyces spartinae TaxID=45513 RepID=A0A9P7VAN0_9ASCO|nr:uncharacterized protein KQ657_004662 [Scheffersomyces spartinae]KAG7194449.1 hypothetical protein KQ657_004662 [Scheffersomyces spartinae]